MRPLRLGREISAGPQPLDPTPHLGCRRDGAPPRRRAAVRLPAHGWRAAGALLPSGASDSGRVLLKAAIVEPSVLEVTDDARKMVAEGRANYYAHAIMNSEFLPVAG